MVKPLPQLNDEQIEALRLFQAQERESRSQSGLADPAALEANRGGQVTREQRRELISRASNFGIVGLVVWLVLLGAIVAATGRYLADHPLVGVVVLLGTLFLAVLVVGRIYSIPMRLRLNNPHVEQVSGEVIWHGAGYVAEARGHVLRPIYTGGKMLPPGLYTFFCLAGTSWLISAEMTGTHSAAPSRHSPEQANAVRTGAAPHSSPPGFDVAEVSRALAQANGFSAADLQANRRGRLSGQQARALLGDVFRNLYGIATVLVIAALVVVGLSSKAKVDIGGALAVALILGLAFLLSFLSASRELLDMLGRRVLAVEGIVTRGTRSYQRSRTTYYYQVDGLSFTVGYAGYNALLKDIPCRVYYAPRTGRLVSMEVLPEYDRDDPQKHSFGA